MIERCCCCRRCKLRARSPCAPAPNNRSKRRRGFGSGATGRIRRTPRQIVLVGARVTRIAVARLAHGVAGQFERRKPRQMSDLLRRDLIDRNTGVNVRAGRLFDANAGEKRAAGTRVIACPIRSRGGIDVIQAAENLQLILHPLERLHRAGQFELPAFAFRPPVRLDRAIREIDKRHPQRRPGGAGRRGWWFQRRRERSNAPIPKQAGRYRRRGRAETGGGSD